MTTALASDEEAVDPDGAGPDGGRDLVGAAQALGEHHRVEAVGRVVGQGHGLLVGVERLDHHHRAEDLLAADGQVQLAGAPTVQEILDLYQAARPTPTGS